MLETNGAAPQGRWTESIRILKLSIWLGILAAWCELGILGYRIYVEHRPSFGQDQRLSLWTDYRIVWMVPLAEVVTLLVPALFIALWARRRPGPRSLFVGVAVAGALATISVLFNFTWFHQGAALLLGLGVGVLAARLVATRPEGFHRLVGRTLGWMVAIVVLVGGGLTAHMDWTERRAVAQLPPAPSAPNVLLIILDTVRSFNLSAYGYERPTTPNIERLARRGVRFEQAFSTAPWTLPSHASIFTGRYPHQLTADFLTPLDGTWPTLAETMQARGYVTAGFVANLSECIRESGLGRGFVHYEDFVVSPAFLGQSSSIFRILISHRTIGAFFGIDSRLGGKDANRISSDFLRWLPSSGGRPFFAFLNYFDAHRPYLPPPPFDHKYSTSRNQRVRVMARGGHRSLPPEAGRVLTDAYDESLVYLDDQLGQLMDELERRGVLKNTIVIITADHGEQFGEHGLFYHGNSLYSQVLHVPLVILDPARALPTTVAAPVNLIDLAPTVLDLVHVEGPAPFPGRSLARYWDGSPAAPEAVPLGAELGWQAQLLQYYASEGGGMRSILVNGMHYLRTEPGMKGGTLHERLFDLAHDPREERDLAESDSGRQLIDRLRPTLDSLLPPVGSPGNVAPLPNADAGGRRN